MDSEELLPVRNYFYMGHFAQCIREAEALKGQVSPALAAIAEVFTYRSLVGMGKFPAVFKGVTAKASIALQAVKLLATYLTAEEDNRDMVFDTLKEWLGDESMRQDVTLRVLASQIYYNAGDHSTALRLVNDGETLEMKVMKVQILLRIDRPDLAARVIQEMADEDDDPLTQLATAWVNIAQGGDKVKEAVFLLQDLLDKFGNSIPILNTLGACHVKMGSYAEAFPYLKRARQIALQATMPVDPDTLINSIVCLQHLNKPKLVDRIQQEFAKAHPTHPWIVKQQELESLFDRSAQNYK